MRIGIVGAENSHALAIAKTLNVQKACGRARVVAIWGETRAFAKATADAGKIPKIVRRPEDMIGMIDGVMVDHRHAKYHIPAVIPFIEARIPAFVDKPFSYRVSEGWKLLQLAKRKRVPVTSYSSLPEARWFTQDFRKQVRAAGKIEMVYSTGPCDIKSRWGGVFFYAIHQVEAVVRMFGLGIENVEVIKASRGNPCAVAVLTYRNGGPIVSMSFTAKEGPGGFGIRAVGTKGVAQSVRRKERDQHAVVAKKFLKMFRTGKEPYTAAEILEPIAVLVAMEKSIKTGKKVKVRALRC